MEMSNNYETQKAQQKLVMKRTMSKKHNLIDQSRIFILNGEEHEYDEKDPIYFR